ncbi:MAG: phosphate regulon sensor histidine kinase PhoR [Paraglaciecola sp.]|uniref:phosphate regulon sensor histidine kinase PhoR n=1 Tax=Pseudomonadati TaxID=3379134 RepID=UPI00273FDC8A|nr:phosphate regulon sensor histidine kinase PhoR [Paraglaciecola sp.]MDP5028889.1 phosphate regulon sensor histidine kinase PhoR [Paraglaciecola sp.]MDP5129750.1 phosphate regulon sensor histidine kinase PhoR [Paraglaciecola sp.]
MEKPYLWLFNIVAIFALFALVGAVGSYFSHFWLSISLLALAIVAWQSWLLFQLNLWVWHSKKMSPITTFGIFGQLYQGIHANQLKSRRKRKQLSRIISSYKAGSEALPDAVVIIDHDSKIVWCNRLARIELGLTWPEKQAGSIVEAINRPDFTTFITGKRFDSPLEIPSPANGQKILEFRVVPFVDNNLMLLIRDVTRLSQIEKMRKDFVANVSHELRTPLTVINGYLEMLPDAADMPPLMMNKAITEMRTQSIRMQTLIEELLQLSRIEASNERTFDKLVNVPQLLWQIQSEAQALNRDKQHKLFFDISPRLRVYGIESELRSAFSNLIFNAIHYTPDKGVIEVKWHVNQNSARFSVKDNGDGIAAQDISRITERFYRVDKARSRKTGGSGLGLSIVKHVLTHHNSNLKIASAIGVGSDFSCEFSAELTHISNT